jgi:hypothetical protein
MSIGLSFHENEMQKFNPILQRLENNKYLLAKSLKWFPVYSFDQTVENKSKSQIINTEQTTETSPIYPVASTNSINTVVSSPLPLSPYDGGNITSSLNTNDLRTSKITRQNWSSLKVNNLYFPELLDPNQYTDEQKLILHSIYMDRIKNKKTKDDWTLLNKQVLRQMIGGRRETADQALKGLLDSKTIECDGTYSKTSHKSYGYRLRDIEIRHGKWRSIRLDNQQIVNRLDKGMKQQKKVIQYLEDNLYLISIEMPPGSVLWQVALESLEDPNQRLQPVYEAMNEVIGQIDAKHFWMENDPNTGRVFSTITNLKKQLRKYLRVDGVPVVEVDISNSQPLFLSIHLDKIMKGDKKFKHYCQTGELYDFLAAKSGTTRNEVKVELITRILFGANGYRSKIKKTFEAEFPKVAEFIRDIKSRKSASEFAILLQNLESKFVIHKCCERIRKERGIFLQTIHDSIICLPQHAEYVKKLMEEEFERLNISINLKIKGDLCPST